MLLCGRGENCVTCVSAPASSVFKARALLRSSSGGESATSKHSTSVGIPDAIVDYLRSRPAAVVALHRERRRLPRGTRSDSDARCEFILRLSLSLVSFRPATRLPIFFSANDHEHPIACAIPFSPTPPTPVSLDRPPVCRSCVAMFELNDEPELVESPRPRVWAQ